MILMRKRKIAGENLQGRKTSLQNYCHTLNCHQPVTSYSLISYTYASCDNELQCSSIPFVIISPPSSQRQDHLSHQRQVEDGEKPVESIVLHKHHSPHAYERDEDKERPGHHSTDELEEHVVSSWGTLEELWQCQLSQGTGELYVRGLREFIVTEGGKKAARARLQQPAGILFFPFTGMLFRFWRYVSCLQRLAVVDTEFPLLPHFYYLYEAPSTKSYKLMPPIYTITQMYLGNRQEPKTMSVTFSDDYKRELLLICSVYRQAPNPCMYYYNVFMSVYSCQCM